LTAFIARFLADIIIAGHLAFVAFVVLGGLLVSRWPRLAWVHVPSAIWGVAVEFAGWICPLTPIENALRERAGVATYHGDFIEQYVLPLLYPAELTRAMQVVLGTVALGLNVLMYGWLITRIRHGVHSRSK